VLYRGAVQLYVAHEHEYTGIKGLKDFLFKYPAVQLEDAPGAQRACFIYFMRNN